MLNPVRTLVQWMNAPDPEVVRHTAEMELEADAKVAEMLLSGQRMQEALSDLQDAVKSLANEFPHV